MTTQTQQTAPRPYRKRKRAESELKTRQRITEAAVALHQTVGPARTSVKAIAERAGVDRATVYRHFPDEQSAVQRLHQPLLRAPPDARPQPLGGDHRP
jgi:AcrR family transcriptional regulator